MAYILNSSKDIKAMLKVIGVRSVDELFEHIPASLRMQPSSVSGGPLSEFQVKRLLETLAAKNRPLSEYNSFLGAGCYDHYVPAALSYILSHSEFLTAYTPYQAECSQGALQAIYEYQSFICLLTGMDVSNASLFDGASSLAEAVLMSMRVSGRKKIIALGHIHPEYMMVLKTYLSGINAELLVVNPGSDGCIDLMRFREAVDKETACCFLQSPNFFGLVEETHEVAQTVKAHGALTVMITNPISLAILKEPAALGVDIACGCGQPLGGGLNFGGPGFGFLAARRDYLRQLPGRIVGKTVDKEGTTAYCLTLQTREQHIRREKATSNICSNQSLNAIGAAVYCALMGRDNFHSAARNAFSNTQYLYQRLRQVRGVRAPFPNRVFNEFFWEVDEAKGVMARLFEKKIIAGYRVAEAAGFNRYINGIISCCTETKTKTEIDIFVNTLAEVLHG